MMKWTTWIGALALVLALGHVQAVRAQAGGDGPAFVDENGDGINDVVGKHHRHGRRGILGSAGAQLSDVQKTEIKTIVDGLKASEATREEVRAAVEAKFADWGIALPERPSITAVLGDALSEGQATELTALIDGLRASDASREDIHAAVEGQLETWGIEKPEKPEGVMGPRGMGDRREGFGHRRGRRGHFGPPPAAPVAPVEGSGDAQ
jgi:hypothetical protein